MIRINVLVFLIIFLYPIKSFTQQTTYEACIAKFDTFFETRNEWYAQIRFDYYFDDDSVDVVLEGYPMGKYSMSSIHNDNYAYFGLYIFKMENNMLCLFWLKPWYQKSTSHFIENISGDGYLSLSLRLNNRPSYYRFDLSKGRHIYIHKNRKRRNRFVIKQQTNYQPYIGG